ncbi:MAG: hypothetical protein H6624_19525 [Bdellovibrionaceae bacterium]|nr:hypothetical protein [Bdellovibrionales bacterium]MCB9086541.1 hypothetical protein [Pseudobdellovibrionaceae bacterium]
MIEAPFQSNKGFALVVLVGLLPILLCLLLIFSVMGRALLSQSRARHTCRTKTLETQVQVAQLLQQLLSYNDRARRLRLNRRSAQSALALAHLSSPQLVPLAKANLQRITYQQTLLGSKQRALIARMDSAWEQGEYRLRTALRRQNADSLVIIHPRSAFVPMPPTSLSPSYALLPGARDLQRQGAKWKIRINPLIGGFENFHLTWPASCASTIVKEKDKWVPQLIAVK